ncbi:bifunctional diguanylate cyclase/phosphodiesterase [Thiocystis violacea]|uniref:bifunctional diguanylate cyclase/phosphodiesterase n=1 Tax=Thiocystis violacea TaxID=13725 RepID=UPI001A931C5A|nr:EAL domain-containing protein [Thiocystis violacea]
MAALRVAATYFLASLLWILVSDRLMAALGASADAMAWLQSLKGGLFVALTSLGLYWLLRLSYRQLCASEARSRTAQRLSGVGVWEWILGTDQVYWSPEVRVIVGEESKALEPTLDAVEARVHPDDQQRWRDNLRDCLKEGKGHDIEFRILKPDGQIAWVAALGDIERDASGQACRLVGVVMDVTARKEAEQDLHDRLALEAALADAATRLVQSSDETLDSAIGQSLQCIGHVMAANCGLLIRVDDNGALSGSHPWSAQSPPKHQTPVLQAHPEMLRGALARLRRGEILHLSTSRDPAGDLAPLVVFMGQQDLQTLVLVPILREGRLLGAASFETAKPSAVWTAPDGRLLRTLGAILAAALDRQAAARRNREHTWYLENLDRLSRTLVEQRSPKEPLRSLTDLILEVFEADRAWLLYPCDPHAASFQIRVESTRPEFPGAFAEGSEVPIDGFTAEMMRLALANDGTTILHAQDIAEPPEYLDRFGVQSRMMMALRPEIGDPWILGIHQCAHPRPWTAVERRLFQASAERVASALSSHLLLDQVRESENRLLEAERIAHLGHWELDIARDQLSWSDEVYRIFGVSANQMMTPERLATMIDPADWPAVDASYQAAIHEGKEHAIDYRIYRQDGEQRWIHCKARRHLDAKGRPLKLTGVMQDITERVRDEQHRRRVASVFEKYEAQLHHLSQHDALTNLPNRLLLDERLAQALRRAERQHRTLAVLFLDLDHFKHINDSLGHPIGDRLLQAVATRLTQQLPRDHTLARIGGDEFVLLLEDIGSPESVGRATEELLASVAQPYSLDQRRLTVSASAGIALYPRDGQDPATLLRNADAALHRAKREDRDNYQFYTQALTRDATKRIWLENGLRQALAREEFRLVYQPQLDLASGCLIGLEALIRWPHPERGEISPGEFIPIAEDIGLIHRLGDWVLDAACRQGVKWLERGLEVGRIAVNVAGPQLKRGNLAAKVARILAETGLPAKRLELEVTEGFIMAQAEAAIAQLDAIRDLGVTLSIDDFGTGYSSLSYLKRLPIHKLKIDQSFVRDIPSDADDMAISAAIIAMGKSLKLTVIAEGVETPEQARFLQERGCQEVQGYLYGRPAPPEELEERLASATRG